MNNNSILILTGGHHTSGLAIANILKTKQIKIIWFGHRYSSWKDKSDSAEYREVTQSNIEFINLQAGKFHHTFQPVQLLRIPWGFIQAFYYILLLRIKYGSRIYGIVSFGGYLAVPVVICGWLLGIKSITHEQTMVSGYANRLISFFCIKIAVSWPQSLKYLPSQKCVVVGLPVRLEVLHLKAAPSPRHNSVLYITGGKQGSHTINQTVFSCLPKLLKKFTVVHQTGSNSLYHDFDKAKTFKDVKYIPFEYASAHDTAQNIQKATVVVSRAGAHIIAELLYFKKPCVLIPIPAGSHNEQEINAAYLADRNMAIILNQSKLTPDNLLQAINQTINLKPKVENLNYNGLENLAKLILYEFYSQKK